MRRVPFIGASMALALVVILVLPGSATAADGAVTCQLVGIVHLDNETNLTSAAVGTGEFTTLSGVTCEGTVDGLGTLSGGEAGFSFCRHNTAGTAAACHDAATGANTGAGTASFADDENGTLLPDDTVYDTINGTDAVSPPDLADADNDMNRIESCDNDGNNYLDPGCGADLPIVADFKGTATFAGFATGDTCVLNFIGHATGVAVEIAVRDFNCTGGLGGTQNMDGLANAVPGFLLGPCQDPDLPPTCFGGGPDGDPDVVFVGTIEADTVSI